LDLKINDLGFLFTATGTSFTLFKT